MWEKIVEQQQSLLLLLLLLLLPTYSNPVFVVYAHIMRMRE